MGALEILSPGPLTTVQDMGRLGYGRYGVAQSGALDPFSLRIANLLVGNPEGEACLEVTLSGLKLRADLDVVIAVTGANLEPHLNATPLEMWRSHVLRKNQTLSFKRIKNGCRAYLAVGGGLHIPLVLGSKSTNLLSRFGGFDGRPLRKGDILPLVDAEHSCRVEGRSFDREGIPSYDKTWLFRVILGPQDDEFTEAAKETFLHDNFRVTPDSDRTGIRLKGSPIRKKEGLADSIISEGVISGTIQIPGDGQPIIILNETVTGGYRKIATVIGADLPLLGQLKPGDEVVFKAVSADDAYIATRGMEEKIRRFREGLRIPT